MKLFLGIVIVFVLLMFIFLSYVYILYLSQEKEVVGIIDGSNILEVEFEVNGMICVGCEGYVEYVVNELEGIIEVKVLFKDVNVIVKFNSV